MKEQHQNSQIDLEELENVFLNQFDFDDLRGKGYFDVITFGSGEVGFSIKKRPKDVDEDMVSLIKIGLTDLNNEEVKKPLIASAGFGEAGQDSVRLRSASETKPKDPIDIEIHDEYFFDTFQSVILKNDEEVFGNDVVERIFDAHTKPQKRLEGLPIRFKVWFVRNFLTGVYEMILKLITLILALISGERYSYNPLFEEEDSKLITRKSGEFKRGKTFKIFNYEAPRWAIIFYSIFHLVSFLLFYFTNGMPVVIERILSNNFLIIVYVISTLWFIESALPTLLKISIRKLSSVQLRTSIRKIKIQSDIVKRFSL